MSEWGASFYDPHLKGEVRDVTEKQAHEYNRKTINMQLCNIFGNAGIDSAMLSKYNMTFSIDPYNYSLKVSGVDDAGLTAMLEKLLNKDHNARELFTISCIVTGRPYPIMRKQNITP